MQIVPCSNTCSPSAADNLMFQTSWPAVQLASALLCTSVLATCLFFIWCSLMFWASWPSFPFDEVDLGFRWANLSMCPGARLTEHAQLQHVVHCSMGLNVSRQAGQLVMSSSTFSMLFTARCVWLYPGKLTSWACPGPLLLFDVFECIQASLPGHVQLHF